MNTMAKTPDQYAAAIDANTRKHHMDMAEFHDREATKYARKAGEAEAKGKGGAARRATKVAERNRVLAAKHRAALT